MMQIIIIIKREVSWKHKGFWTFTKKIMKKIIFKRNFFQDVLYYNNLLFSQIGDNSSALYTRPFKLNFLSI